MSVQVWNKNPNYDPSDPSSYPGEAIPISGRVNSSINNLIDVSINSPSNGQTLIYNDQTEIWENGDAADLDVLETCKNVTNANTSEWTSESYSKGDYVIKNNHLYCAKQTTSSSWVASEWEEVNIATLKNALANSMVVNDLTVTDTSGFTVSGKWQKFGNMVIVSGTFIAKSTTTNEFTINIPRITGTVGFIARDGNNGNLITMWGTNYGLSTYLHSGTITIGNSYNFSFAYIERTQ